VRRRMPFSRPRSARPRPRIRTRVRWRMRIWRVTGQGEWCTSLRPGRRHKRFWRSGAVRRLGVWPRPARRNCSRWRVAPAGRRCSRGYCLRVPTSARSPRRGCMKISRSDRRSPSASTPGCSRCCCDQRTMCRCRTPLARRHSLPQRKLRAIRTAKE